MGYSHLVLDGFKLLALLLILKKNIKEQELLENIRNKVLARAKVQMCHNVMFHKETGNRKQDQQEPTGPQLVIEALLLWANLFHF